jgi:hypothetical protein
MPQRPNLTVLRDWIHSELREAFERQGEDGIVVWYDAGGTMSELVDEVIPEGVRLIKFDGSFLALRFDLESESPHLSGKWLIYVPEKPLQESWLRDFELLGERLEMDFLSLLQRRCNLPVTPVLTDLLRNRLENPKRLVRKWERLIGDRTVTESEIIKGLLAIAFGLNSWDIRDAVLSFLCKQNWQDKLSKQGLWEIWRKRLQEHFNWTDEETPGDERGLKGRVRAAILLADLACSDPSVANHFPFVPSDPIKRQTLGDLAKQWRDSTRRQAVYRKAANEVERQYNLQSIISLSETMVNAETFRVIDDLWVQELRRAVRPDGSNFDEKVEDLRRIAETRKGLFWSRHGEDEAIRNFWEALELAAKIWLKSQDAIKVSEKLQRVEEFVRDYTSEWWQLDYWALQLAAAQTSLSGEDKNRFVNPAWVVYRKFLDSVNRAFMNAVKQEGWQPTQWTFWQNIRVGQERVAIFIVDALRFDLAKHLQERVGNAVNFEIRALKTVLPSITEIGMAALLPNSEGSGVAWESGGLVVKVQGQEITSKSERKDWLGRFIGQNGKIVDLDELEAADLSDAKILVVFSQELDRFGTFASDLHPQGLFDMVDRIAQGVKFVAKKGFQKFFVVADHGFLFTLERCEPSIVQAPLKALATKRRFVVGGQTEGCWIVQADEVGLQGDLLFAFPEGFAVFALQGEQENFLHGGLSLQESIVPMLCGQAVLMPKVKVRMQVQEPISSRIARVTVEVQVDNLFAEPRKVRVCVGKRESSAVEVSNQKQREEIPLVWLNEFETPPDSVTVQLLDDETNQILERKQVKVQLLV